VDKILGWLADHPQAADLAARARPLITDRS
jgi:hypothetical protein